MYQLHEEMKRSAPQFLEPSPAPSITSKTAVVQLHPPFPRWFDVPVIEKTTPYSNQPIYHDKIEDWLWLPRDPSSKLDLDDTVECEFRVGCTRMFCRWLIMTPHLEQSVLSWSPLREQRFFEIQPIHRSMSPRSEQAKKRPKKKATTSVRPLKMTRTSRMNHGGPPFSVSFECGDVQRSKRPVNPLERTISFLGLSHGRVRIEHKDSLQKCYLLSDLHRPPTKVILLLIPDLEWVVVKVRYRQRGRSQRRYSRTRRGSKSASRQQKRLRTRRRC